MYLNNVPEIFSMFYGVAICDSTEEESACSVSITTCSASITACTASITE
jgi:hypothetical protein